MSEEIKYGLIPLEIWKREKPLDIFNKMIARELPAPPIGEQFNFLLSEIGLDPRWCLIHATQMTEVETRELAVTGAVLGRLSVAPLAEALARTGVRRVVVRHDLTARAQARPAADVETTLARSPGFVRVGGGAGVTVWRVTAAAEAGAATGSGNCRDHQRLRAALRRTDARAHADGRRAAR